MKWGGVGVEIRFIFMEKRSYDFKSIFDLIKYEISRKKGCKILFVK